MIGTSCPLSQPLTPGRGGKLESVSNHQWPMISSRYVIKPRGLDGAGARAGGEHMEVCGGAWRHPPHTLFWASLPPAAPELVLL